MSEFNRYDSTVDLVSDLGDFICEALRAAIAEKGRARLVVSGGSTPLALFRYLRRVDIPWDRVAVTLADERLVPPDHDRSNEKLVRNELLQDRASTARFVPLQDVPDQWQTQPRFDLVLLGMGADGHTASLFPDAPELGQALRRDGDPLQKMSPPSQPDQRLTLTLGGLCDSAQLVLHIEGEAKLEVLRRAETAGAVEELPVRALLRQKDAPLAIYWAP